MNELKKHSKEDIVGDEEKKQEEMESKHENRI